MVVGGDRPLLPMVLIPPFGRLPLATWGRLGCLGGLDVPSMALGMFRLGHSMLLGLLGVLGRLGWHENTFRPHLEPFHDDHPRNWHENTFRPHLLGLDLGRPCDVGGVDGVDGGVEVSVGGVGDVGVSVDGVGDGGERPIRTFVSGVMVGVSDVMCVWSV